MKPIIGIVVALSIMLTGCSSAKNGIDTINSQSTNNTLSENASPNNTLPDNDSS